MSTEKKQVYILNKRFISIKQMKKAKFMKEKNKIILKKRILKIKKKKN